ncbi:A-kinase anchor protein 10, mitochondrial-like isoform X1 [Penaeus japonicus]|uniref:A-kinase anchor protein 10, mitochondrial-like isoform X1 n=1 Tax=Penaeus japonicus TaxID=27405 RepID=UPI001C715B50|nr:A-kinase anchor protein 10, mitochondrial-like isoform X1 [Penaeus japonicus]
MSSLWKKFRGGSGGGSPNHMVYGVAAGSSSYHGGAEVCQGAEVTSSSPSQQAQSSNLHFITSADEDLFMSNSGDEKVDPLQIQSQFVKTVEDILNSHSTLPYFLQFLQGWGAEKYARFWLDATSFRAAAVTRIRSQDVHTTSDLATSATSDRSYIDYRDSNCTGLENKQKQTVSEIFENYTTQSCSNSRTESFGPKEGVQSRDKGLVLPDLVSNIKHANDVTPLNSPDGSFCKVLHCDGRTSDEKCVILPNHIDSVKGSNTKPVGNESVTTAKPLLKDTRDFSSPSASVCSRAQKLRQSIAEDAMKIFNKYIARDAEQSIGLDDDIREVILQKISVVQEDIDSECFAPAQKIVFGVLEREYLPKFLASDYYLKHQIDVLTSGSVRLADILYSDSAFPYFMEYVEQEGGRQMLQLWVAASNFRQQLIEHAGIYDPQQAQSDAMVLYDKYFSLQATCPQGFSDRVRFEVESNICREEGPLPSCFNLPLRVVLHVLERDFLPGYLSSSLHIKYLSELINTVKTSIELLGRKKRSGSESTCSSEQSSSYGGAGISSQNTLLAMDTSSTHRFHNLDGAMRIDEAQITDPDSLWRRKNFSKMSCGFINELGRFESELQPEPDRKTESKISRTLKRFVNMDEDKVKEDMAYKVAEMIIKDVTSVTLGSQGSNRSSMESSQPPLTPSSVSQDNLSDVFPS